VPSQATGSELLFPVSLVPGELPEYRVVGRDGTAPNYAGEVVLRKAEMRRIELSNMRFRAMIDTSVPALIEAYSLSTGPHRMLNLVETTPDEGEDAGWTSLGGTGAMTGVELVETGPPRAPSCAGKRGEASASRPSPFLPFDRFTGGSEYEWPTGPE